MCLGSGGGRTWILGSQRLWDACWDWRSLSLRSRPFGSNPLHLWWTFLRECRWGWRHFWKRKAGVGYRPVPGSHCKKVVRHTRTNVGCSKNIMTNTLEKGMNPECPCDVMVKALDWGIVVSEFELQWERYEPLILPGMSYIVLLLFFWKCGFGIK